MTVLHQATRLSVLGLCLWSAGVSSAVFVTVESETVRTVYFALGAALMVLPTVRGLRSITTPPPPLSTRIAMAAVALFGGVAVLSTLLQATEIRFHLVVLAVAASVQIALLAILLPRLFSTGDYEWTLRYLGLILIPFAALTLLAAVLDRSSVLGIPLVEIEGARGPLRHGFLHFRYQMTEYFRWMPGIFLILALSSRGWRRDLAVLALILSTTLILVSFTRSAYAVVGASLVPVVIALARRSPLVGFLALAGVVAAATVLWQRVSDTVGSSGLLTIRLKGWRSILNHLQETDSLIWGVGLYNYWDPYITTPHSVLVGNLLYYGLVGTALYLLALGALLAGATRQARRSLMELGTRVLIGLLGSLLVLSLFEDALCLPLYFSGVLFWLLLGKMRHNPDR